MEPALGRAIHADLALIESAVDHLRATDVAKPSAAVDAPSNGASFTDSMKSALHRVDAAERGASDRMAAVDSGRSDDLVGAMLASQDASLSFSMLMQVRNKVMGAVEDLVKLPL